MSSMITRPHSPIHHAADHSARTSSTGAQPVRPTVHRPVMSSVARGHECEDQCHYCQGPETD